MDGGEATGDRTGDAAYGSEADGQDYVDRSKIDFDPSAGLYTGTAVAGTSEIPGPHEAGEAHEPEQTDELEQSHEAPDRTDGADGAGQAGATAGPRPS